MSEHQEQAAVITWARYQEIKHPELKWLHSSLNGIVIPSTPATRYRVINHMKSSGMKNGIPDLFLPIARKGYHGLFIEMKFGKNKLTKEQKEFKEFTQEEGYAFHECRTADEAINVLIDYLEKPVPKFEDKSGNGNHAVQATEVNQPTVRISKKRPEEIPIHTSWENPNNFGYKE